VRGGQAAAIWRRPALGHGRGARGKATVAMEEGGKMAEQRPFGGSLLCPERRRRHRDGRGRELCVATPPSIQEGDEVSTGADPSVCPQSCSASLSLSLLPFHGALFLVLNCSLIAAYRH
jgi:hypothetical protein